jgi:hypothetical protein
MATKPTPRVLESLSAPQHYVPPSAREMRAQAVQRLQAGLFGLAAIVLVVGLANIINDRARMSDAGRSSGITAVAPAEEVKSDPLADIGVVPSTAPEEGAATVPSASPATNP